MESEQETGADHKQEYKADCGSKDHLNQYQTENPQSLFYYCALDGGNYDIPNVASVLTQLFLKEVAEICIVPRVKVPETKQYFFVDVDDLHGFTMEQIVHHVCNFLKQIYPDENVENFMVEQIEDVNLKKFHVRFINIILPDSKSRLDLIHAINNKLFASHPVLDGKASTLRFPLFNKYKDRHWIQNSRYLPCKFDESTKKFNFSGIARLYNSHSECLQFFKTCDIFKFCIERDVTPVDCIITNVQYNSLKPNSSNPQNQENMQNQTNTQNQENASNQENRMVLYGAAGNYHRIAQSIHPSLFRLKQNSQAFNIIPSISPMGHANFYHHAQMFHTAQVQAQMQINQFQAQMHHLNRRLMAQEKQQLLSQNDQRGPIIVTGELEVLEHISLHYSVLYSELYDKHIYKISKVYSTNKRKATIYFHSRLKYCDFKGAQHSRSEQYYVYLVTAKILYRKCRSKKCQVIDTKTGNQVDQSAEVWRANKPGRPQVSFEDLSDSNDENETEQSGFVPLFQVTDYSIAKDFHKRYKDSLTYIFAAPGDQHELLDGFWYYLYKGLYYTSVECRTKLEKTLALDYPKAILSEYAAKLKARNADKNLMDQFKAFRKALYFKVQNRGAQKNVLFVLRQFLKRNHDLDSNHDTSFLVFEEQGVWDISKPDDGLLSYDEVHKRIPEKTFISNDAKTNIKYENREEISEDRWALCDKWLSELFPDPDTRKYILNYIYICLTKEKPKLLIYLFGKHNNGKSAFLEFIQHIFGSYAFLGDAQLLTAKPDPTIMHQSKHARVVYVDECPTHLSQAQVRKITGNRRLFGRAIYSTSHVINCNFKLILASNYLPANVTELNTGCRYCFIFMQSFFADPNIQWHPKPNPADCIYQANPDYITPAFFNHIAMPFLWRVMENSKPFIYALRNKQTLPTPQPSKQSDILGEIVYWSVSSINTFKQFVQSYLIPQQDCMRITMEDLFDQFNDSPYRILIPQRIQGHADQIQTWFQKNISKTVGPENIRLIESAHNKVTTFVCGYNYIDEEKIKSIDFKQMKQDILHGQQFRFHKTYSDDIHDWIRRQCFWSPSQQFEGSDLIGNFAKVSSRSQSLDTFQQDVENILNDEILDTFQNSYQSQDSVHPTIFIPASPKSNTSTTSSLIPFSSMSSGSISSSSVSLSSKKRSSAKRKTCAIINKSRNQKKIHPKKRLKHKDLKVFSSGYSQSTIDSGTTVSDNHNQLSTDQMNDSDHDSF